MTYCPHCGDKCDGPLHAECADQLRRYAGRHRGSTARYTQIAVERARRWVQKYDEWKGGNDGD